jgi:hypothetical protein
MHAKVVDISKETDIILLEDKLMHQKSMSLRGSTTTVYACLDQLMQRQNVSSGASEIL